MGDDILEEKTALEKLEQDLMTPSSRRIFQVAKAFQCGFSIEKVHRLTYIDPWFLRQIDELVQIERALKERNFKSSCN